MDSRNWLGESINNSLYTISRLYDPQGMVPYGSVWFRMVPYSSVWFRMVPYGSVWFRMVPYGSVWVPYGSVP